MAASFADTRRVEDNHDSRDKGGGASLYQRLGHILVRHDGGRRTSSIDSGNVVQSDARLLCGFPRVRLCTHRGIGPTGHA